jgi:hypothetical protein
VTRSALIAIGVLLAVCLGSVALFRFFAPPNPVGRWQSSSMRALGGGGFAEIELREDGRASVLGIDGVWSKAVGGDVNIRFDQGGLATVALLGTDRTLNLQWKGEAMVLKRNSEILGEFHRVEAGK